MKLEHLEDSDKKKLDIDKVELQSLFMNRAKQQIEAYQNGLIDEKELIRTTGVVKFGSKYVCSSVAIMQEIRSLQEKNKLASFEGFKETFTDYYEKIEFISDGNVIEEDTILKAKTFLRRYIGKKLGVTETSTIIAYLNSIGIEGKKFAVIVRKVGFRSVAIGKKGYHELFEEG